MGPEILSGNKKVLARVVFYITFIFSFIAGGALYQFNILSFRIGHLVFLTLPIMIFYRLRVDQVFWFSLIATGSVVASAVVNGSTLMESVLFLRLIYIPLAMYFLTRFALKKDNIIFVLRLCVTVGILQLPIVIIQRLYVETILAYSTPTIAEYDMTFGSFYISNDVGMCFFLNCLIIFLLFDRENNRFIHNRIIKSALMTLVISLSRSKISQIAVILIWFAYVFPFALFRKNKIALIMIILLVVSCGIIASEGIDFEAIGETVDTFYEKELKKEEIFLSGGYARLTTVLYYVRTFPSIFGGGPSKYYNPITQEYTRGVSGFLLTFYSEVGLLGLTIAYMLLYAMTRRNVRTSPSISLHLFALVVITSLVSPVTADTGIMLTYSIFAQTALVPIPLAKVKRVPEI